MDGTNSQSFVLYIFPEQNQSWQIDSLTKSLSIFLSKTKTIKTNGYQHDLSFVLLHRAGFRGLPPRIDRMPD